jgi:type IV pilus assembly protein PilA
MKSTKPAFTLLEILLVVAAIAVLASIVIVAINPGRQLAQTKNSVRRADVGTIINAIYQYAIDTAGTLPSGISTTVRQICRTGIATSSCNSLSLVDLSVLTSTSSASYLVAIPSDPNNTATSGAGYFVQKTAGGRIKVSAPSAELGETIEVTK